MSTEALRQSLAAFNATSPVGVEVMEEVRGRSGGEAVALSSAESVLKDAAEEIGMSVAHRAEKRELGHRDVRQGQGANLEAIARIAEYYDKLPDMPREAALKALLDRLASLQELLERGGGGGATKEDVLAALQGFDPDVTHQFAALEMARDYFAATGAPPALQTLLDQARGDYERADIARDVQAGFAAAEVASRAAATLETDPATVRDVYRTMLRESLNMGQLFDALARFDVLKSFGEAVETFMTAAGRDLASTGPSSDPAFLHGLLTELGKLKRLQSVFDASKDLIRLTDRLLPRAERGRMDPVDATSRVLNFAAKPAVTLADARGLLGRLEGGSLAGQVAYANGLRGLHAEIPDDVMPSLQARQQQTSTLMALLDRLVADEEAEFERGPDAPAAARPALPGPA